MQVWEFAFVDDRILQIRTFNQRRDYYSPSPVPAVTRVCQESRKHCGYQKVFLVDGSSRYIWTKFDSDIIMMLGAEIQELMMYNHVEVNKIRRLRIILRFKDESEESASFDHIYSHRICDLPKLEGCDIWVNVLFTWRRLIEETYWESCPKNNVRIIDRKTGEWIDADTAGSYLD